MHSRLTRLRSSMREHGLDALLVTSLPNVRYLTRFTGSSGLCLVSRRNAWFVTDGRYSAQSEHEVVGWRRIVSDSTLFDALDTRGLVAGLRNVGVEGDHLSYSLVLQLRRRFKRVRFLPTRDLVEDLALTKESGEIAEIRRAIRITERVYGEILRLIRPGVSERDIAAEISFRQKRYGADRDAFEPIVASGPRSALPHARPTGRKMRRGDLVVLDFGSVVRGYGSDLTRTVCVGDAPAKARRMHAVVLEAQRRAIAVARPGIAVRELDGVARSSIVSAGYRFPHALGHGLGLRAHERPWISRLGRDVLREGNVVTIEPGVYVPGYGGVRIEDDVLITGSGCRVLTHVPRELITV
jgi:Xaa-Pro aminopeptidase